MQYNVQHTKQHLLWGSAYGTGALVTFNLADNVFNINPILWLLCILLNVVILLVLDHMKFKLHSFLWSSIYVLFPVTVGKN